MSSARHHGASATATLELDELDIGLLPRADTSHDQLAPVFRRPSKQKDVVVGFPEPPEPEPDGILPSPTTASETPERWNQDWLNVSRTLACFWGFIVLGANDAALGALIPYLETYYDLTYTIVSLVFIVPIVGYTASALSNNSVHLKFGQRGIAICSASIHVLAYTVAALHPPFPVLVVFYTIGGFGSGLCDAAWNAWIGNMANSNEILGFLHAAYGLGATLAPIVATSIVASAHRPWWYFYYFMISIAAIELLTLPALFWSSDGARYRATHPRTTNAKGNRMKEALTSMPAARVTWLCTAFLGIYVGTEVALGGWIVTFMLRVRKAAPFAAGMTSTGFWLGMTIGRLILGFVTPRLGENLAIFIYIAITGALELIFWLVPQFYVSAVAVGFQGFFLGPLFPTAIVAATKLLPKHLHVSAIGFSAAASGCGAAAFPFAVGAIAQAKGVQVLQPIVLAALATEMIVWFMMPRISKKKE